MSLTEAQRRATEEHLARVEAEFADEIAEEKAAVRRFAASRRRRGLEADA